MLQDTWPGITKDQERLAMKEVIHDINSIEGVKNVKRFSGPVLKINLFSRPIPGSEAEEISGDLRKISQKIRNSLDDGRTSGSFDGWEWIIKPDKKYQETKLGNRKVSDRKDKGHKPAFYKVSIQEQ